MAFTGNSLDRAETRRADAAWLKALEQDGRSRALAFSNLSPRLSDDRLDWQPLSGFAADLPKVFLGLIGDSACYAVDVGDQDMPELYTDARTAAAILPVDESAIVAQGRSLLDWHARHGFCAMCGSRTEIRKGGLQRVCRSDSCQAEHFPRVDPVVIMLVTRGDHCLMGRQSRFPPGMVSALAGFMEPGETIEETVRREVHEETAVPVGEVRYVMSQPWPFPSNLMIGCLAEGLDDKITIDPQELESAGWYSRADVQAAFADDPSAGFTIPQPVAVAHHLLKAWLAE
nr:NAD(+) diphosphatase [Govania unica]